MSLVGRLLVVRLGDAVADPIAKVAGVFRRATVRCAAATRDVAAKLVPAAKAQPAGLVTLSDWSPHDPVEAEVELVTAILYSVTDRPEEQLRAEVRRFHFSFSSPASLPM